MSAQSIPRRPVIPHPSQTIALLAGVLCSTGLAEPTQRPPASTAPNSGILVVLADDAGRLAIETARSGTALVYTQLADPD
ncbi:MAG: hypothetical protein IT577_11120, partial [Verrucomicrobiae bacterium]|nr:hypothetical protein [Verrucomicrobiae bacterium]